MKELFKMWIYLPVTIMLFIWSAVYMINHWGGKEPLKQQNLNVKSIRANPTSFRTVYMPRILAGGGK